MVPDNGSSSGSLYDPSSVSLFAMVHEFLENDDTESRERDPTDVLRDMDSNKDFSGKGGTEEMTRMLQRLAICADSLEATLLSRVHKILDFLVTNPGLLCDTTLTHSCVKRLVMSHLRKNGYNAAICKTKWDHVCGIPAGEYEYIDVHSPLDGSRSSRAERVIVDIDFHSQFKIARATEEFQEMWKLLPPTFVGRPERLKRIVNIMSDATKLSLKATGLHLPPWRKPAYMRAKWFSSYKRTSNGASGAPGVVKGNGDAHGRRSIAVKRGGLDVRYASVLETLYQGVGLNGWIGGAIGQEKLVFERAGEQITTTATDWQPPAVDPRRVIPRKGRARAGLSSLLLQGPTGMCNHQVVQVV